jgi:hypothetical protein
LHAQGSPSWADYLWGGNFENFIGVRYLTTSEVFYCPAQYYRQANGGSGAFRGNYGMNKDMNTISAYGQLAPGVNYIIDPYNSAQIFYYKLASTFRPSEVYLLGDSSLASLTSQNYTIDMATTYPDFRHPINQMEMLFHDGHVEKLPSNEIPTTATYPHSYAPPWWPPATP